MCNRLVGGATRVNADDVGAARMAQLRARRFAPYQAADPPVATVVMLARSLAADNVAALAALRAHRTKPYDRRDGGGDGMTRPPWEPSSTGELAGLGAGALLVLCSAAPDLLAGGARRDAAQPLADRYRLGRRARRDRGHGIPDRAPAQFWLCGSLSPTLGPDRRSSGGAASR
jgi:hypothetical protein